MFYRAYVYYTMMMFLYMTFSMLLGNVFIFIQHPISLGLILIAYAMLIGLYCLSYSTSWFFYLLVLVFLGGVMVLIIYMSTLSSNEKFSQLSFKVGGASILVSSITVMIISPFYGSTSAASYSLSATSLVYENSQLSSLMLMMVYLLFVLICIVKLVKFESGPLVKRL